MKVLDDYREDYEYALESNWDGEGAIKISDDTLRRANDLIDRFGTIDYLVEVGPGIDGSLSLIWENDNRDYIYLDVGPENTLHLYYDIEGFEKWEAVSTLDDKDILEKLSKAFQTFDKTDTIFLNKTQQNIMDNAFLRSLKII